MTKEQFKRYNFKYSLDRIFTVSNHISEGVNCYTKAEAAEVARFWSLEASLFQSQLSSLRSEILASALKLYREK